MIEPFVNQEPKAPPIICANCGKPMPGASSNTLWESCGICGAWLCRDCYYQAPISYRQRDGSNQMPGMPIGAIRVCNHCLPTLGTKKIVTPDPYLGG